MKRKEKLFILAILISLHAIGQSMPSKKYIEYKGNKICYYEEGDGEAIVLLHGWPQTSYAWRQVIPNLSKEYRVIAIDLPGTGNSGPVPNYDTKSIARSLHDILSVLGIKSFHLVGHDVGSWVAATYALLYEYQLNTLTLIDAGIPGLIDQSYFVPENARKIWQFFFNQINMLPEQLVEGNESKYLAWFFNEKTFVKSAISDKDLKVYYKSYKGKKKLKYGFNYYRAFAKNCEITAKYKKVLELPVLAVGGDHGAGNSVGKSLKGMTTDLKSVTIENCGHYIPEERPLELSALILGIANRK